MRKKFRAAESLFMQQGYVDFAAGHNRKGSGKLAASITISGPMKREPAVTLHEFSPPSIDRSCRADVIVPRLIPFLAAGLRPSRPALQIKRSLLGRRAP